MDSTFWNLFWTTGMPEAWLMSRGRGETIPPGAVQAGGQGQPGPLGGSTVPPASQIPGSPNNLY